MPTQTTENNARPLLLTGGGNNNGGGKRSVRRQGLREAARLFRHESSGRRMREPSMLVRESAAEQLEERQSDWAYSKPVVVLDFIWNLAFIAVATVVLVLSSDENPNTPLRVWTVGYGLQCDAYAFFTKHLESANTMFSFIWWIIGFYWVSSGGQELAQGLCIVFLGFDVFFVVFCIALACVTGIAVCCCLPCIIAVLYAVAEQKGASKEDIGQLTKFKFRKECCICLSPYEDETELRELPCGHHFHCSCVDKWLYIHATCPLCKYSILKDSNYEGGEEV
ncbi:hypothetical protein N665_0213s0011 [Sinapis alba]|nr:hypothetical protein N665_0213s0011 [Sinapis alba]